LSRYFYNFSFIGALFLFSFSYLLPDHYYPWVTAYQEFLAFSGAFFLVLFLLIRFVSILAGVHFFLFCSLSLIPLLQLWGGVIYFSGDAWIAAFYLFCFSMMLLVGYNVGVVEGGRRRFSLSIAGMFVFVGIVSVWMALCQWLMLAGNAWVVDMRVGDRPFANLAQPNNLATLLCVAVVAVFYLYERRFLNGFSSSLLVLLLVFGVVLTQSRTPWVGFLVAVMFLFWKNRGDFFRLPVYGCFVWIGVYLGLVVLHPLLADFFLLPGSGLLDRALSLQRWPLWVQLWMSILEGPLLGYGWGQVSVAQVAISQIYPVPMMVEHSHNILLDLLIWMGPLLGGAIILLITLWLVRLGVRARSLESIFCLTAAGFVLVHGMLEFPLEYGFFLLPVGLFLGVVAGEQRSTQEWEVPRWLIAGVLTLCVGMFAWVWYEYRVIEEDHRLMRFETARIGQVKAKEAAPDVVLLSQLREFIRFARTPATEGMSEESLEWMRKIAHRYPYPPSLFRYALALALNGQEIQAREQLIILRAMHGDKYYDEGLRSLEQMAVKYPQLNNVL
jgi:O-antigen ligase